ncbi:MAG: hypothetical protein WBF71_15765 [Microthrixaceae bacterium]
MALGRSRVGTILEFDDDSGLGTVRDQADGSAFDFHCTAIVDGSRHIDADVEVTFDLRATHGGRIEASQIVPRG